MSNIGAGRNPGFAIAALLLLTAGQALGQRSKGSVEVHGFFSQGYAVSDNNNYLTMQTSRGTAQMTDGG
ncbi:MAG TPA: hypothetical protein VML01_00560, partial [Bryobacterales bacterium]|nr:hypothetical protein [Bryobacterales bacterium]